MRLRSSRRRLACRAPPGSACRRRPAARAAQTGAARASRRAATRRRRTSSACAPARRRRALDRHAAECEQHRVGDRQVTGAAVRTTTKSANTATYCDGEDEPQVARAGRAAARTSPASQIGAASRAHGQHLPAEESGERARDHLVRGRVAHELERRPAVRHLPRDVGSEHRGRERRGEPRTGVASTPPPALTSSAEHQADRRTRAC